MLKMFMGGGAAVCICLAGLVSCSSDKKTDVYSPSAPKVMHETSVGKLSEWAGRDRRSLDLADSFDFSEAAASRMSVRSRCKVDNGDVENLWLVANPHQVSVFQFLPEVLLTLDLNVHPAVCGLEFNLYNEAGSNHVFNLNSVVVEDHAPHTVQLTREPGDGRSGPMTFDLQSLRDIKLRYENPPNTQTQLICTDMKVAALNFDHVMELSRFNYSAPIYLSERNLQDLESHPTQKCRAVALQNSSRIALSPIFDLTLFAGAPEIEIVANPSSSSTFKAPVKSENLSVGKGLRLNQWKIKNAGMFARIFRIAKRPVTVASHFTYIFSNGSMPSAMNAEETTPALYVRFLNTRQPVAEDAQSLWTLVLGGETLTVEAQLVPSLVAATGLSGVTDSVLEPILIEELGRNGQLLGRYPLTVPTPMNWPQQ